MEVYEVRVGEDRVVWYQKGQLHRLDGPAIERSNGTKYWYQNNKLHRLDGPAIEWAEGGKEWFQNDQLHRLDGPAVEYADGRKEWRLEGERLTEEEFNRRTKPCLGKKVIVDGIEYTLS